MTVTPNAATTEGSSPQATAAPLPSAMPKKANPLHLRLLGGLLETKRADWTQKKIDPRSENPKKPELIEVVHAGTEVRYPLARNVSEASVERASSLWLR